MLEGNVVGSVRCCRSEELGLAKEICSCGLQTSFGESSEIFGKSSKMSFESVGVLIIWLAPRAGKMNEIARCDWLPERARWSDLAPSGLPAVSRKQNFPKSHTINPLLTKFVRSRWLDIVFVLFCEFMDLDFVSVHKHAKKELGQYPAILIEQTWSITHTY